jgi:hypothetical protein
MSTSAGSPIEGITKQIKTETEAQSIKAEPDFEDLVNDEISTLRDGREALCDVKENSNELQLKFDNEGYCFVHVDGNIVRSEDGVQFGTGVWFGETSNL